MDSAIGHCRHLVNFRFSQTERLNLAKVLNKLMDDELVKKTNYIINFIFCKLK